MTCAKTQGFLARHKMAVTAQTDAKKATIKGDAALGVLKDVDEIYAAKGKQIIHVDLKRGKPPRPSCSRSCSGPPGKPPRSDDPEGPHAHRGFDEANLRARARVTARRRPPSPRTPA